MRNNGCRYTDVHLAILYKKHLFAGICKQVFTYLWVLTVKKLLLVLVGEEEYAKSKAF